MQQQEAQAQQAAEAQADASAALAQAKKEAAAILQEAQAKAAQMVQQQEAQAKQDAEATKQQVCILLVAWTAPAASLAYQLKTVTLRGLTSHQVSIMQHPNQGVPHTSGPT